MSCFKCYINTKEYDGICKDIFTLFSTLGVPLHEQVTLWNMAIAKIGCKKLKNTLLMLIQKQRVANK